MTTKKISTLIIFTFVFCAIVFLYIYKTKTTDDSRENTLSKTNSCSPQDARESIVLKLNSPIRYERQQALAILGQQNPLIALEQFKRDFKYLYHEAKTSFTEEVIPKMTGQEFDSFFLKELRIGLEAHKELRQLSARVEKQEPPNQEFLAKAKELYESNQWWMWLVRARSDLAYVPIYDEIYSMLTILTDRGFPLNQFAQVLHIRNSSRAEKDFTNLLSDPDPQMKLRGIWALEAIRFVPESSIIQRFFESAEVSVLDQSDQYVLTLSRKDLPLLFSLIDSPSARVHNMAEYQLGRLTYLNQDQVKQIGANATTPQQKTDAWRTWWKQHNDDSDEILRKRAFSVLIDKTKQQLTPQALQKMAKYPEQKDIYPFFRKALVSDEKALQAKALEQLSHIATSNKNAIATDMIISFYENLSPDECGQYAVYLAMIDDERCRSLLLNLFETQGDEDTRWKENIIRSIGMTGQSWILDPLVDMIIEQGSSSAAAVFSLVDGSESAIPGLLDALLKQENDLKRHAIFNAIKTTGSKDLSKRLSTALQETTKQTETFKSGIRFDVLQLMESFPDPNSKQVLLKLLESDNPWDNLGAARILGRLGDDSGVDVLIKHIKRTNRISASFYNNRIGDALLMIGSPKTKILLENHFQNGDLDTRKLTLHVMAQQLDPVYIPFIEKQLKSSEPELASAACFEISYLINAKLDRDRKYQQHREDIDLLSEDDLPPIQTMLLWAFFDTKINDNSISFPDHQSLAKCEGAVIRVNRYQQIEFNKSTKKLKLTTPNSQSALITSDGKKAGRQQPYAAGSIERSILGKYMTVFLKLNYGGAGCFFKRKGINWKALGYTGGVIE